jgi:MFS transporter, DHA1 family, multidrug resistance protein
MRKYGKAPVVAIALITGVCLLGNSSVYVVLPIFWREFGLTAVWQIGVLLSVNRLLRLPLNPLVSRFYKRYDKRTGILAAVAISVVSTLSIGFVHGFAWLLLMRCLWGAAWCLLRMGGFLTVLDASDDNTRGHLMGTYNGLWGFGHLIGMVAGGFLADAFGVAAVAVSFAALALCAVPLVWRYIPAEVTRDQPAQAFSAKDTAYGVWRRPGTRAVLATGLLVNMLFFGVLASTMSLLVEQRMPEPILLLGFTVGAATLGGIMQSARAAWDPAAAPWFGKITDGRLGRKPLFTASLLMAAVLFTLAPESIPAAAWVPLMLLLQLASTAATTTADSLASDAASRSDKVAVMTAYSIAIDLGAALGPLAGYLLADGYGLVSLYRVSAVLLVLLAVPWLAAYRKERKQLQARPGVPYL